MGQWETHSFTVSKKLHPDLIVILRDAAKSGQKSDLIRRALYFYLEHTAKANSFDLGPVMDRLLAIEELLVTNGTTLASTDTLTLVSGIVEDEELAHDLDNLI